jgi:hypothetical protein
MGSGPKQPTPAPPPEIKPPTPAALPTGPYGGLGYMMPGKPTAPSWATGAWSMGPMYNARGGSRWGNPRQQQGQPQPGAGQMGAQAMPGLAMLQQYLGNQVRDPYTGMPWQPPNQTMQMPYIGNPWG